MADNVTKQQRSRTMAAVRSIDTQPELIVRQFLHSLGYRYRLHKRELPGCPDIVFPARKKIINVHGCFWHMHTCGRCRIPTTRRRYWIQKLDRNRRRDQSALAQLRRLGWRVLTIWECQTKPQHLSRTRRRIAHFLETGQPGERRGFV